MGLIETINLIIGIVFFACYSYQFFFIIIPFVIKPKPHKEIKYHKYAILIPARNEELVIKQLLDSISEQTYPQDLITTFVVADNCNDNTASVARGKNVVVLERENKEFRGKGYALNYLFEYIKTTYSYNEFDGYFVFDADNVLEKNYIEEMNKGFSDGYKILTSYRNSKNYGDNWVSAGYALWFLREAKYLNYSRFLLNTSCAISGTGFLFSKEIVIKNDGWKYYLLTEDIEFTVSNVINGEKIGYCGKAIFYDEQPTKFRQSWKQRMRWARGYLQVYRKYGWAMIKGALKGNFSCYDMSMTTMPAIVLTIICFITNIVNLIIGIVLKTPIWLTLKPFLDVFISVYLTMFILGAITIISEWKKIHTSTFRKILFGFTFPIFMMTYIPISFVALFKKVRWEQIEHRKAMTLVDIKKKGKK
ncbi:MAG TPA: glycosyltransferase family 2 protein [Bacilli bacterium]|nr:glycosyltransferase family 2 protein [Bacilli bacterium]